jgi:hypothetical protein
LPKLRPSWMYSKQSTALLKSLARATADNSKRETGRVGCYTGVKAIGW